MAVTVVFMDGARDLIEAVLFEMRSERRYHALAEKAKDKNVAKMFALFASNENWHVAELKKWLLEIADSKDMKALEHGIHKLKEQEEDLGFDSDKDMLLKALEWEEGQVGQYSKFMELSGQLDLRELFNVFRDNESSHAKLIKETLVDMFIGPGHVTEKGLKCSVCETPITQGMSYCSECTKKELDKLRGKK